MAEYAMGSMRRGESSGKLNEKSVKRWESVAHLRVNTMPSPYLHATLRGETRTKKDCVILRHTPILQGKIVRVQVRHQIKQGKQRQTPPARDKTCCTATVENDAVGTNRVAKLMRNGQ
jgi:hypothetical protein